MIPWRYSERAKHLSPRLRNHRHPQVLCPRADLLHQTVQDEMLTAQPLVMSSELLVHNQTQPWFFTWA